MLRSERLLIIIALLLVAVWWLASCAAPAPDIQEDSATAAALVHVKARLMAGESARFRQLRFVDGILCGEVAALNAAKEYVGWRRFAVVGGRALIQPDTIPNDCR